MSLKVVSSNWDISMGLCVGLQTAPYTEGRERPEKEAATLINR